MIMTNNRLTLTLKECYCGRLRANDISMALMLSWKKTLTDYGN